MRYSRQREMILNALKSNPVHPTADYIYGLLRPKMPALSLGTVYRNLSLLAESGAIKRLRGAGGKDRFDHNNFEHCHLVCKSCGRMLDMMLPPALARGLAKFKAGAPMRAAECEILLYGICKDCQKKVKEK
jgi:Fur family peroxide stress response transcriptional regulator